ncbi:YeeE/YedE thiosulfate transporter family protein [Thiovibrio sp. JS02]
MREEDKGWSPYVAGALTGVLAVGSVLVADKFIGASTTFATSAGMIERLFAPDHVAGVDYFKKHLPRIDWQFMFVFGIIIGAFLSALTSKSFKLQGAPDMWAARFGADPAKRGIVAFVGGAIALFGARLAGGCPSGHGLSGFMQLSVSGIISIAFFFAGGLVVANLLYKGGE